MIKAIETQYKGYRFRSRLEARWAVFFDALGVKWEYEIEGYDLGDAGWYLPDFWLPELSLWVEIKGDDPNESESRKAAALCEATKDSVAIFSGSPWFNIARAYFIFDTRENDVFDTACYFPGDSTYDYEKEDGDGCYYQGWHTWGIRENRKPGLIVLVESDDVSDAHAVSGAYEAARSARFEHGENGY